jgi:hypothetical protein
MHGYATFPGVNAVIDAEISVVQGISPSVCTMRIAPQAKLIKESGPLTFYFDNRWITWSDCKIDNASIERNKDGQIWKFKILDRRWRWVFGEISGAYNLRNADNTIREDTKKSARDLARLCCFELGEDINQNFYFDVTAMPEDVYPQVQWNAENPAEALAMLCDIFNCRVILSLKDEYTRIVKVGEGEPLPNGPIVKGAELYDAVEMPNWICVATAPIRYQCDLMLEAVGLDTDGKIKAIDSLSYKPSMGWSSDLFDSERPNDGFQNVLEQKGKREHALAVQTVYRWYRILNSFRVPGYGREPSGGLIEDRRQVLPLFDELAETILQTNPSDNTKEFRNRESLIYGTWSPDDGLDNISSTLTPPATAIVDEDDTVYTKGFSLDTQLGIVKFSEPIFRNTLSQPSFIPAPAILYLRASFNIKDKETNRHMRYWEALVPPDANQSMSSKGYDFGQPCTHYIIHNEIQYNVIQNFWEAGKYNIINNEEDVEEECRYYLDAEVKKYINKTGETRTYAGLIQQDLDGAIQQVTYTVGQAGTYTTISRNDEQLSRTLPYEFRRRRERERAAIRKQEDERIGRDWKPGTRWDNAVGRWVR